MAPGDGRPQFEQLLEMAVRLYEATAAEAVMVLVEERLDWAHLRGLTGAVPLLVAADDEAHLAGAAEQGLRLISLDVAGLPVHDVASAAAAARRLRGARRTTVLATGIRAGDDAIATLALHDGGIHVVETPRVDMPANGTGDSFAALFLGRLLATRDVADALGHAASAVCALLRATAARGERELALVPAQDALVAPGPRYEARPLAA